MNHVLSTANWRIYSCVIIKSNYKNKRDYCARARERITKRTSRNRRLASAFSSRYPPFPIAPTTAPVVALNAFPSPSEITMDVKMHAVRCDNGRGMLMRRRSLDRKTWEENFARKIYELEETSTITCRRNLPSDLPSLEERERERQQSMNDVKYRDKESY